jgi:peroxiredoxin Q/BCP
MALKVGAKAPEFSMPGSDDREWTNAALAGRPYVVTFYPEDETPGCIAQVCALRDVWEDLHAKDVLVFGVSRDSIEKHKAFVANRKLPYTLLTDQTGQYHKAFDVGRTFGVTNRVTYLIGKDGKVVDVYASNLRPEAHAAKMVDAVAKI